MIKLVTTVSKRITTLLLGLYIASLLIFNYNISFEVSLSFILAIAWVAFKLSDVVIKREGLRLGTEGILLAALYLYIVGVDAWVHGGSLLNPYYKSFALNSVVFLLLIDTFNKNALLRERMMQIFCTAAGLVALLLLMGIFVTKSQSGRLTFMQQNENDLALNLLIAFTFIVVSVIRHMPKKLIPLVLAYSSSMVVLNALIDTGTRFAIAVAVVTLLVPIATASRTADVRRARLFALACLAFIVTKVVSFSPTLERLMPQVSGNNLDDLGGRTPLWRDAVEALIQSPITGLGHDGFEGFILQRAKFFGMPHNFVLEVGALGGGIGLVLLAALVYWMLRRVYSYWVQSKSFDALIWCMPVCVSALMLNITHMKAFWFLAAYSIALASSTRTRTTSGDKEYHVT